MAGILRIFCGCLQDKMHCLVLYSSPRDWAVFPSGTKVGHNKQVLTINFSQPQCYVFKIRRLKNVLGRVSLSNRLPAKPKLNVRRVQMGQACVEHDHFENTPTFLWSMGQWELFDAVRPRGMCSLVKRTTAARRFVVSSWPFQRGVYQIQIVAITSL